MRVAGIAVWAQTRRPEACANVPLAQYGSSGTERQARKLYQGIQVQAEVNVEVNGSQSQQWHTLTSTTAVPWKEKSIDSLK